MKKIKRNSFILALCFFAISLSGCNTGSRMQQDGTTQMPGQQGGTMGRGDTIGANPMNTPMDDRLGNQMGNQMDNQMGTQVNPLDQTPQMNKDTQKQDMIRNGIKNIPGVADVSVAVDGNSCLVGYRPSNTGGDANATKTEISKKVKELDKTITNVKVSESADIMSRIKKLSTDFTNNITNSITNGNNNSPMNEISNSFNKLMNEIK